MTDREREEFRKAIDEVGKKITSSKKEARKFLMELGILNSKGRLTKAYKDLCIPDVQD